MIDEICISANALASWATMVRNKVAKLKNVPKRALQLAVERPTIQPGMLNSLILTATVNEQVLRMAVPPTHWHRRSKK